MGWANITRSMISSSFLHTKKQNSPVTVRLMLMVVMILMILSVSATTFSSLFLVGALPSLEQYNAVQHATTSRSLASDLEEWKVGSTAAKLPDKQSSASQKQQQQQQQHLLFKDCTTPSSFQDIKQCRGRDLQIRTDDPSCRESIVSWDDVHKCVNQHNATSATTTTIQQVVEIHLIGERNTGSKFVVNELKKCFPTQDFPNVRIHRDYTRPKHWFQRMETNIVGHSRTSSKSPRRSLVVATFRDPYDWVAAMIENPYHSPNHFNGFDEQWQPIPMSWQDFVSRPWSMQNRSQLDLEAFNSSTTTTGPIYCSKYAFEYHQVMPCILPTTTNLNASFDSIIPPTIEKAYFPLYELQRNVTRGHPTTTRGVPFDNILQFRADKIVNFLLEVPLIHRRLEGFLAVRYEDLILQGTQSMLEEVARMLGLPDGLPSSCKPQEPQPWRFRKREIPKGLKQWIDEHLNHETERLLDYPFQYSSPE
jgi:hypothetical protein